MNIDWENQFELLQQENTLICDAKGFFERNTDRLCGEKMPYFGPNITKINVMILENELGLAHTLSTILEGILGLGSMIKICHTTEMALPLLQIHKFDLIISDWRLAGMDFVARVRQSLPDIPLLIMTTADTDQIEEQTPAVSGYYIKKPFEISELTRVIDQLLHLGIEDSFPALPSDDT